MIVLITSVHYADFLGVTLPGWQCLLPGARFRVVTSWSDRETRLVAQAAGVDVVRTNAWRADGAKFNRGRALNEAMRRPTPGEVVVSIDADVYPCGTFPGEDELEPGVLYGCARYLAQTPAELAAHLEGFVSREALPLMGAKLGPTGYPLGPHLREEVERTGALGHGYFQCFRYGGQRYKSSFNAGGFDTTFAALFPVRRALHDFYVLHLGASAGRNWAGRVLPKWEVAS